LAPEIRLDIVSHLAHDFLEFGLVPLFQEAPLIVHVLLKRCNDLSDACMKCDFASNATLIVAHCPVCVRRQFHVEIVGLLYLPESTGNIGALAPQIDDGLFRLVLLCARIPTCKCC
jgi:hypothetical protein